MPDWVRSTALDDILGVDFDTLEEDPLYRVLDKLHPHRFAIETALVSRERSLFNLDASIYLYDLSSTYFEGVCAANEKAKRGYSRDHRPDCKQVVVGLVVNRDGFPITHEIFAGNTQDRSTLVTMLDRLSERVGLSERATVVLDRGMAYDGNLDELRKRKLHFVVASRQPERNRWLAEFEDTEGFTAVVRQPSPRNPAQKKTTIEVKTYTQAQLTYVLCRSEQRIAKDLAIRSKHEKRMQADIDKLSKRIADGKLTQRDKINQAIGRLKERYPRVARYVDITYDPKIETLLLEFNADKKHKAAQLDGCYLLKTSRTDLSGDELWRIYSLLTRAEDAFRDMKTPLAERPIFHQLERRVDSHIFLCVIAYHLLAAIEQTLLEQGVHTSWASVRNTLKTHQICTIVLPTKGERCLRIRKAATPDADVKDLYRRLAVSTHIINPTQTWSEPRNSD
jgi:transposase